MVSYQVLAPGNPGSPLLLAKELLGASPIEQALAGELLNLVGYERAASYLPKYVQPGGLWSQAQTRLLVLATEGAAPDAPATLRHRAGLALGALCYGALSDLASGTTPPLRDPRLLDPATGNAPDGQYWCLIEESWFWFGDDTPTEEASPEQDGSDIYQDKGAPEQNDVEKPLVQDCAALICIHLPYDYQIARYPVTNAEYARFVADDGYTTRAWWTDEGWKFLQPGNHRFDDQEQPITLPRYWQDPELNNPLQPVVGLSWYEAAAYCRWIDGQLRDAGLLDDAIEIRLPTALEWERAARHTDQRPFPWGNDELTPERANYNATSIGTSSPVGCFPQGRAECGALDMSGNIDEWTATLWEEPEQQTARKDFTQEETPFIRWKNCYNGVKRIFCGSRFWFDPDDWYNFLGFRLVRSARARV